MNPSDDRIRNRYLLNMTLFGNIKGLHTVDGQQVRDLGEGMLVTAGLKKVNFDNVCAVSANAKRDNVRNALRPLTDELKGLFTNVPLGQKSIVDLRSHSNRIVGPLMFDQNLLEGYLAEEQDLDRQMFGNTCIYKDDFAALVTAAVEQVAPQGVSDERQLKLDFHRKLHEQMSEFKDSRLDRMDGLHTNPAKALQANANPKAKTKAYLRQCFYSYDYQGKKHTRGTEFCFMNSVINSVLAGNNTKAKEKLAEMFTENGFKLYDSNGELKEYKYNDPSLSKDGNISFYEQSLNKHFKSVKVNYNYSAGFSSDAAKALGMKEVDWSEQFDFGMAGNMLDRIAKQKACVDKLNEHIRSGKFVTYCEDGHYVAVKGLELSPNGSVKLSIVDDRANEKGAFEYDKTYSITGFQTLCQNLSFSVLEWPPEVGEQPPQEVNNVGEQPPQMQPEIHEQPPQEVNNVGEQPPQEVNNVGEQPPQGVEKPKLPDSKTVGDCKDWDDLFRNFSDAFRSGNNVDVPNAEEHQKIRNLVLTKLIRFTLEGLGSADMRSRTVEENRDLLGKDLYDKLISPNEDMTFEEVDNIVTEKCEAFLKGS